MSYRKVQAALDAHLQAFPGPILVFPSTFHKPRHGEAFLSAEFIPGRANTVLLGPDTEKEHRGRYKISVRAVDTPAALRQIDDLRAHFASGTTLFFEGIQVVIEKSESDPDKGGLKFTNFPLSIVWRSYFKEV